MDVAVTLKDDAACPTAVTACSPGVSLTLAAVAAMLKGADTRSTAVAPEPRGKLPRRTALTGRALAPQTRRPALSAPQTPMPLANIAPPRGGLGQATLPWTHATAASPIAPLLLATPPKAKGLPSCIPGFAEPWELYHPPHFAKGEPHRCSIHLRRGTTEPRSGSPQVCDVTKLFRSVM